MSKNAKMKSIAKSIDVTKKHIKASVPVMTAKWLISQGLVIEAGAPCDLVRVVISDQTFRLLAQRTLDRKNFGFRPEDYCQDVLEAIVKGGNVEAILVIAKALAARE